MHRFGRLYAIAGLLPLILALQEASATQDTAKTRAKSDPPPGWPPQLTVKDSTAASEEEMKPYAETIPGGKSAEDGGSFDMLPIPSGKFLMGSAPGEKRRKKSEGPKHEVTVSAFWMGRCEVTWDEFHVFMLQLDLSSRTEAAEQDAWADAVTRPTPPYVPMDFGMGVDSRPAACMTQFAAKQYTKWLSMKTGRFYRLPTEAEWEYACRAGTTTTYSFGEDVEKLGEYAWFYENSDERYQPVGTKLPNPFGLHDMHGNVAEWVLDGFDAKTYERRAKSEAVDPLHWPTELYPRVVRGGSWDDDPHRLRSASRRASRSAWKLQDPQVPRSIWYHTDAPFVGFRVVRPLIPPPLEERAKYWEADVEGVRTVEKRQRAGGR